MIKSIDVYLICECGEAGCPIPQVQVCRRVDGKPKWRKYSKVSQPSLNRISDWCREANGTLFVWGDGWSWEVYHGD